MATQRKVMILFLFILILINAQESNSKDFTDEITIETIKDNDELRFLEEELVKDELQNECLISTAADSNLSLNDNQKFILGKCNPVIVVPGVMGSRLVAQVDCPEILKNKQRMEEIRYFCGQTICKTSYFGYGDTKVEEHTLWPSIFNSPFKLYQDVNNKHNLCLGFFMKFFNDPDECPNVNKQNDICLYDPNIKITFYGNTRKTEDNSKCGITAVSDIVDGGYSLLPSSLVNTATSAGYKSIIKKLEFMGYKAGFSLAGLPYDFRRFVATNTDFHKNLLDLLKLLNENTGKKVIVIGHSYGGVNTYNKLIEENEYTNLIEKFISIATPFAGAPKSIETMIKPTGEFRVELTKDKIINVSNAAQKLFLRYMPTSYELAISPFLDEISKIPAYAPFIAAINERMNLEKSCPVLGNCDFSVSKRYNILFTNMFPSLPNINNKDCMNYKEDEEAKEYSNYNSYKNLLKQDIYDTMPDYNRCRFKIFNYLNCPIVTNTRDFENSCGFKRQIQGHLDYYNKDCKTIKNCYPNFIKNALEYGLDKEIENLIGKPMPERLKETTTIHQEKLGKMFEHQAKTSNIKNLPYPKVNTIVIYNSFIQTKSAYYYNKDDIDKYFSFPDISYAGGDGTVPTYSSLLPAIKWKFDRSKDDYNKKTLQIVEFCSLLANSKEYSEDSKNSEFIAIGCDCIYGPNAYNFDMITKKKGHCNHSSMIGDGVLVDFISRQVGEAETFDSITKYPKSVQNAFDEEESIKFAEPFWHESTCNNLLSSSDY